MRQLAIFDFAHKKPQGWKQTRPGEIRSSWLNSMLTDSLALSNASYPALEEITPRLPLSSRAASRIPSTALGSRRAVRLHGGQPADMTRALVDVRPHGGVTRRGISWRGMGAEFVHAMRHDRIEYRFRSPVHLLAAYEQGVRRDGETFVEGLPRSTLRDVARKLTFAPAGHEYREWHDPRTLTRVMYFYFDPDELQIDPAVSLADVPLAPRLFFEDTTLWGTAVKLKKALEAPGVENRLYVEALGTVLVHELVRLNRGAPRVEAHIRGGLAAWQQKSVAAYIDEHLPEQIPLATLAQLVRLSPYYFCRAFKQSFGIPPHRYHTSQRIERAKILLAERKHSVTEIGLTLGFSETSAFTAAFRKITGLTPSSYHRNLA
jgi:AraC family transcriptional regulator